MFTKKYYSPDGDAAGGENTGAENTPAKTEAEEIAELESEAAANKDNPDDAEEKEPQAMSEKNKFKIEDLEKEEEEKKEGDDKEEKKVPEKDKNKPDAEPDKTAKQGDKKAPEKKDADTDPTEPTFKIKDDESADEKEETSSWQSLGKDLGLEVKEETYEAFVAAHAEKLKQAPAVNKEEVLNEVVESFADPEAKELFQFLQNKGKLQDYINPLQKYDETLALSDEAIVRKSLKLSGWEDDKIDKKVQLLKEEEKLDTEAYALRKQVEGAKEGVKSRIIQKQQQAANAEKERETAKKNKEDATIVEAINKVDKFMGGNLPKTEREKLAKRWNSGYYREKFANDPQFVVDAILAYELKDQMIDKATDKSFKNGRHENQEKLHSLKQINTSETGSRSTKQVKQAGDGAGHFKDWNTEIES